MTHTLIRGRLKRGEYVFQTPSSVSILHSALLISIMALGSLIGAAHAADGLAPWDDYRTIIWMGDSVYRQPAKLPLFFQRMRDKGITTAMVYGDGDPSVPVKNGFPYYVENLVNRGLCLKWNSTVTNWDAFVTAWAKTGRPQSALVRDYCLDDPKWRDWAAAEVRRIVARNRPFHAVAYNLRDELSTTFSANPFDYDLNPIALEHFRQWLKTQYPSLSALNAEWQTGFDTWERVMPFTTDQIKNRMASGEALPRGQPDWQALEALKFDLEAARQSPTRWNSSPWADFRTYMDVSLAGALGNLRQAAHDTDPRTPVGIEGTQMPNAFGGYDLWRLSQVLDWVEPYDIGNAREIFGAFMPGRPIVTTVFESDTDHARRRLWHLLLEGDRGCIVWWSEDCIDWKSDDYRLTSKARALAPVLREMTSPLARVFLRAERQRDPVFILYSQPSIQVDWLLESTVDGSTWLRRFSSYESEHNEMARRRDGWLKAIEDAGYAPQFISTDDLEAGRLQGFREAALVLSDCYALSDKTLAELEAFVAGGPGRQMFWDSTPGLFDEHGKLRTNGGQFGAAVGVHCRTGGGAPTAAAGDLAEYAARRLTGKGGTDWADWVGKQLKVGRPRFNLPTGARVKTHRFAVPEGWLVAFERNIEYQMSEDLKQGGGNEALEKPIELDGLLDKPAHLYDLRAEKYLGHTNRIHFVLDPWAPSLVAVMNNELSAGSVVAHLNGRQ